MTPPAGVPLACAVDVRRPIGTFDRRMSVVCFLVLLVPLFGLAAGVYMFAFAREAIGPFITVAFWLGVIIAINVRNVIAAKRGDPHHVSWIECVPVAGCLALLQLFLDLHTPYAGDIAIAVLHAPLLVLAMLGAIRSRAG